MEDRVDVTHQISDSDHNNSQNEIFHKKLSNE